MKRLTPYIFASGLGTRLAPYTKEVPKPLLSFKGTTMLDENIKKLIKLGFSRIFINYSYRKDLFEAIRHKYSDKVEIILVCDNPPSGHGGALRLLNSMLKKEDAYILGLNGDTLVNLSCEDVLEDSISDDFIVFGSKQVDGIPSSLLVHNGSVVGVNTETKPVYYSPKQSTHTSQENNIGMYIIPSKFLKLIQPTSDFLGVFSADGFVPMIINSGSRVKHQNLSIVSFWSFNTISDYDFVKKYFKSTL